MKISQPESPELHGERSSSETRSTDIVEQDERTQQYTQTQRNHQHKAYNTELCIRERTQYSNQYGEGARERGLRELRWWHLPGEAVGMAGRARTPSLAAARCRPDFAQAQVIRHSSGF
ncbi:unnamed protein product [Pleuronectes platessa]|uniref:Uncharacterized protein n=1 Tax=Pleuronectes platessa TaxID=8262 RepID=A0A9N7Z0G8_PLEPL|nr:unnamed protein product [Pleuronectes platessa]